MTNHISFVSVIIPCRNEERFIAICLDSIIAQNYPKNKLEILVVDGMSRDRTRKIIKEFSKRNQFIKLLDNSKRITPVAFNIGIKHAKGDIVMIMSAHVTYKKDYMSKCVKYLERYKADNVGGILITLPGANTLIAQSIALSLSCPFGVGNSYFRIGSKEPRYVDTVPFGCYRKEIFDKIGLFDEDLIRNQDDEFNLRLIKNGGKILLVPEIVSHYYARENLVKLWKMYFQYGYFKPLVAKKVGGILTWRQLIPTLFLNSLFLTGTLSLFSEFFLWIFLCIITSYAIADFSFSFYMSINKGLKILPFLAISIATLHFSYGLGYLKGIWDFVIFRRHLSKKIKNVTLTR